MIDPTFVDTNVLVYARDAVHRSKHIQAVLVLKRLWQERTGRISIQVLNEYYVTLTRKLKVRVSPNDAWDDVQDLMCWNPQRIDLEILTRAREIEIRYHTSWWDSMIVAAAQSQRCNTLLSEDFQEGMVFDGLTVRNPFTMEIQESSAAYSNVPQLLPRPRHRARGRPARSV
jgi:predicted nucleic acid-binding protein